MHKPSTDASLQIHNSQYI